MARNRSKALHSAYILSTILTGEIAQDCIEQDIEYLEEMDDYEYVESVCPEVTKEIELRQLVEDFNEA